MGRYRDAAGRFVKNFEQDVEREFNKLGQPGGPLERIGTGIRDAIGAGFNIPGKSPLTTFLAPVYGELGVLIGAAVEGADALAAVFATLPALVAAVGVQFGVLYLVFGGLEKHIKAAFAAKNADELNKALVGLNAPAQTFVRSLLPLRDLFREIKEVAQSSFFKSFGNSLTMVANALGPILKGGGMAGLASSLGKLFAELAKVLSSPIFSQFLASIIGGTIQWLRYFTPAFGKFLTGLTQFANATLPFLSKVGYLFSLMIDEFGNWLSTVAKNGSLAKWLDSMYPVLVDLVNILPAALGFLAAFFDSFNKAGGQHLIEEVLQQLQVLAAFLESDFGQKALEGLIIALTLVGYAFEALVAGIFVVAAAFAYASEAVGSFVGWLDQVAGPAIGDFFTKKIPKWFNEAVDAVANWVMSVLNWFAGLRDKAIKHFDDTVTAIVDFFKGLPKRIMAVISGFGDLLVNAGKSLMDGLWSGIKWGWDNTVGPLLKQITSMIPSWKGPIDRDMKLLMPAGQAVMQGFSRGLSMGADKIFNALDGFTNSIGSMRPQGAAVGMPIAVTVNFHGAVPTEAEAYRAGQAAGRGVQDQLTARDARLAVRAM